MFLKTSPEVKLCFELARSAIEGNDLSKLENTKFGRNLNLNLLENLISYHELWGIFCHYFNSKIHLLKERDILRNIAVVTTLLEAEFWRIKEESDKENIEIVPLKGLDILFRKEDFIRSMVDLDLLIKEGDIEKFEHILENLGYRLNLHGLHKDYWLKKQYHLEFSRFTGGPIRMLFHVELHWKLDITRERAIELPIWERSKIIESRGKKIRVLSPEDSLIVLMLHQRHFGKMFCLKYIVDAGFLLKNYNLDWLYISEQIEKNHLQNLFHYYFYQLYIIYSDKKIRYVLDKLKLNLIHKRFSQYSIKCMLNSAQLYKNLRYPYFVSHFLFHENLCQALKYLLFLPQEQFAKFYNLPPYCNKTFILYSLRPIVFLFKLVKLN